jgi:hypothetical protein
MKEGAAHKVQNKAKCLSAVRCPLPAKRSLSKQTQFFLCDPLCRSVAKNAKQTQIIAFSAQKQGLPKKQTQSKPKIERPILCLSKEAKSSFCQNKANSEHRSHEKTKRTQFFLCVRSLSRTYFGMPFCGKKCKTNPKSV